MVMRLGKLECINWKKNTANIKCTMGEDRKVVRRKNLYLQGKFHVRFNFLVFFKSKLFLHAFWAKYSARNGV